MSFKWGHCAITQEPLKAPIVACQLGRLYNKMAILESLLDQSGLPDGFKHIKNLREVKELNLTNNPAFKDSDTKGDSYNDNVSPYICPVIGLEMNGKYRFVYFWSCGCVISERALKAVKTKICHKCQKPFSNNDIIILNGTDEDLQLMSDLMKERQKELKAKKKQDKINKKLADGSKLNAEGESSNSELSLSNKSNSVSKCSNSTKHCIKRPNNGVNMQIEDPQFKKTKLDYSVAKDPKATEVFKSIFTSHKSADKQTKAHWVTYNPFYN